MEYLEDHAGLTYWIAGILYDIVHGVGNYLIMISLGKKLFDLVNKLNNRYFSIS